MILVTGGTGFVGHEVVKQLLGLGYHVRLLSRHPERGNPFASHPRVEIVPGDALRPDTLPAAMEDVEVVIHLIGIIAETSKVTYEQAHIEATLNVLAAAKRAGVTRWVQMSAIGTRPFASSRYHLTKWQAEELVRQSGLDWTIFRPSLIYGYDDRDRLLNLLRRALSWPLSFLQLYSFPLLDGGEPLIQPVSVREVARCFALAPAKEAAIGQCYDLVGPVAFSWREMVFKIMAALGREGFYEDIPILLILRKLLWLTTLFLPFLIIAGLAMGEINLAWAAICAGLWAALLFTARRWRQTILYRVPGEPLILAGEALNAFAPRGLRCSEVLKMAVEDNVGDPRPATETFAYTPESFEQGLAKILK
ncbi:MAG: NAD(P)H-binding protein [Methylacidiphilales bacterium]|nr:NAD(P)H-binding protein [Candidatus Methylacidiphilales bacterium]